MKEKEIRPKKIFDKFLQLTSLDIKKYFKDPGEKINCVACGEKGSFSFIKQKFSYYECLKCKTLFVNPRPKMKSFENFYKKTQNARQNKIFKPRANIIFKILRDKKLKNYNCVDIGGGTGIFAKEISKLTKKILDKVSKISLPFLFHVYTK